MRGIFLKTPMVRMGSQNHMRGDYINGYPDGPIGGVALARVTAIGAGGGGGGMFRKEPEENFLAPKKADGERGSAGQLRSNVTVSIRPDSTYSRASGGSRARGTITGGGNGTADAGGNASTTTFADLTAAGGNGGRGGWVSYPDKSNWNRVPANVTNPDGFPDQNLVGRGGFGGDEDSYGFQPWFGSSAGRPAKTWVEILD